MKSYIPAILILMLYQLGCKPPVPLYLGQGIMAGEATDSSVMLQTRITASDTLVGGDLKGAEAQVRFEMSEDENFKKSLFSDLLYADSTTDYIVKYTFTKLKPNQRYFYRASYGKNIDHPTVSKVGTFITNAGKYVEATNSLVVVTGMNYYHFHYGPYDSAKAYNGDDKALGYPALAAILALKPDYFIGTGDNVYFDHPAKKDFSNALKRGKKPHPGGYDGNEVTDEKGMRRKYHEQFVQQRFQDLFFNTATYWEKDDHDYRKNDADPYVEFPISHELGMQNFREQLPVVDPESDKPTYRTHRINSELQIWMVEGRDFRSPNDMPDGPDKTIWGKEQLIWLKESLSASDAVFKLLISPTPMVGPDDASKSDNHVNPDGFRHEGEAFFDWLIDQGLDKRNFYIVCGDRHWQYHAMHPKGIEEFSTGALVDNNSRAGRLAGDPESTDPDALIKQYYIQGTPEEASGGFLMIRNIPASIPELHVEFYDEKGVLAYKVIKMAAL
ncbi:MAG: alkaline phosphatase D family protein [Cyclobacteriaceae bacterium]|nr:alkaline phosphatase D family protein [Cyclobacteriaceae bacterium]